MKPYILVTVLSVFAFAIAGCVSRKAPPTVHLALTILMTGTIMMIVAGVMIVVLRLSGVAIALPANASDWTKWLGYAALVAIGDVLLISAYMMGGDPRTIQGIVAALPVVTFSILFVGWRDTPPSIQHCAALMCIVVGVLMFLNAESKTGHSPPTPTPQPPDLRLNAKNSAEETIPPPHRGRPF